MSEPNVEVMKKPRKSELDLLERAAVLLDAEAKVWADGHAVRQEDGELVWPTDTGKQVEARHHSLVRTAERLREMRARLSG